MTGFSQSTTRGIELQRRFLVADCIARRSAALHFTKLHPTVQYYTVLYSDPLHSTLLYFSTLHYTTLHYTTLHCTAPRPYRASLGMAFNALPLADPATHPEGAPKAELGDY